MFLCLLKDKICDWCETMNGNFHLTCAVLNSFHGHRINFLVLLWHLKDEIKPMSIVSKSNNDRDKYYCLSMLHTI